MNVSELKAELDKYPDDMPVTIDLEGIISVGMAHEVFCIRYEGETTVNLHPYDFNDYPSTKST